jgi:hypothetical protein
MDMAHPLVEQIFQGLGQSRFIGDQFQRSLAGLRFRPRPQESLGLLNCLLVEVIIFPLVRLAQG